MLMVCADTSTKVGSLAVLSYSANQWSTLDEENWEKAQHHSELTTLALEKLRSRGGWKWSDVGSLALGVGPGSFTGIRVGVNLVRSLGFALNKPIYATPSTRLIAEPFLDQGRPVTVVLNAFRNEVFVASYLAEGRSVRCLIEPQCFKSDEVSSQLPSQTMIVGDGSEGLPAQFPLEVRASNFASIFNRQPDLRPTFTWSQIKPLYLRASAAEEKLKSGELRPFQKR